MHQNITNLELAELLRSVAAGYQLKDEEKNRFRIIAYQKAADAIEHLTSEAKDIWDEGKLDDIPGVGKSMVSHLNELFKTGRSKHFDEIIGHIPSAVFELMKIPGIGVKTAYKLVNNLKISNKNPLADLRKAAETGRIADMEGFGKTSEEDILKSLGEFESKVDKDARLLLPYAESISNEVIEWLKRLPEVKRADPLGSLRRKVSTVGDIDISAATNEPAKVLEHFTKYPDAHRILEKGPSTASIIVSRNIQVDLMVQPPDAYGSLLQHFTGSKHHNIALREYAIKHGMSLSEYGIKTNGKLIKTPTEEEFYKKLGLSWIPPELREDMGEIEAAKQGKLPHIVELKDIKGDLQIHSDFDIETSHDVGSSPMEEVIKEASNLGYEYIAFTEHNPSKSKHNEAQIIDILKRKREKVDKINYSLVKGVKKGVKKVFNSLEIDILPDGKLPVSEAGLQTLDFALVSIHGSFKLSREAMTTRVLSALSNPKVKIFAHPTARKLNQREGVELNWPQIFEFCKKENKWLEINADPARLDLPDFLVKEGLDKGVSFTLGTDSHHKDSLINMKYGVYVARRGWVAKDNIVNTKSLREFESLIE